jgi:hypothetical protein
LRHNDAVSPLTRKRAVAAVVLIVVCGGAWFFSQPRVPAGQAPLVTLDAASLATFREAFNRDADHVRIVILQSPT